MGNLLLVPFMGVSRPTAGTVWDYGLPTVNGASRVGSFDSNGGSVYYGFHTGSNGSVYLSYSSTANCCNVTSSISNVNTYNLLDTNTSAGVKIYYTTANVAYLNIAVAESDKFNNLNEIFTAFRALSPPEGSMNIKYSIQNGSVIGPAWISPGGNVTSYVTMQAGFSLTQQDISITRNGIVIPFAYSNGVLTFTAPSS